VWNRYRARCRLTAIEASDWSQGRNPAVPEDPGGGLSYDSTSPTSSRPPTSYTTSRDVTLQRSWRAELVEWDSKQSDGPLNAPRGWMAGELGEQPEGMGRARFMRSPRTARTPGALTRRTQALPWYSSIGIRFLRWNVPDWQVQLWPERPAATLTPIRSANSSCTSEVAGSASPGAVTHERVKYRST
jgi:hypothetical protein